MPAQYITLIPSDPNGRKTECGPFEKFTPDPYGYLHLNDNPIPFAYSSGSFWLISDGGQLGDPGLTGQTFIVWGQAK